MTLSTCTSNLEHKGREGVVNTERIPSHVVFFFLSLLFLFKSMSLLTSIVVLPRKSSLAESRKDILSSLETQSANVLNFRKMPAVSPALVVLFIDKKTEAQRCSVMCQESQKHFITRLPATSPDFAVPKSISP